MLVDQRFFMMHMALMQLEMILPDKVLIVERVIESLGLQAVRDSLVG